MPTPHDQLEELFSLVTASEKYASISPDLIREIGARELAKRRSLKEAVKETRNKLHQVGSAYQEKPIPYAAWLDELKDLPNDLQDDGAKAALKRQMSTHASTAERLSILPHIFHDALGSIAPLHSILDLACGLNPLCLPWMPAAAGVEYAACDIYADMTGYLNHYFEHFEINGSAFVCDLTQSVPTAPVQAALLLKTIPCLDQVDKNAAKRLLTDLQAQYILVSFPAHSLGGKSKGMLQNYENRFNQLTEGESWKITKMEFTGELAFLIEK
jgi:16S rRNA (guanine(1405)-N(7))-methyltransferase